MKKFGRVSVLRLGHRLVRDDRVTTHVALVARAFGAQRIFLVDVDREIKEKVDDVTSRWGGDFEISLVEDWKSILRDWRMKNGIVVHLTMYGISIDEVVDQIRDSGREVLVIVGAEKVPKEIFELSDYNVAIGNQPHSEVSALAIFLDRYFRGEELKRIFPNYRLRVIPSMKNKKLEMIE